MNKRPLFYLLSASLVGIALVLVFWAILLSQSKVQGSLPDAVVKNGSVPNVPALRELPPPVEGSSRSQDSSTMCLVIYTGTSTATFTISNPGGISGFNAYHLANFDQRLLSQSATAIDIETTVQQYVDTRAPFPVDTGSLPGDIRNYLLPEPGIQSDDPLIVAKAIELVSSATTQAEAVDAIQSWVRGNIAYDYTYHLPNDASSVFRNRSGVCAGFSTLTVALLRAAGIPARYQEGCVSKFGWAVGDEGGWHAWIETYFPDVGWVASDPQTTANFVDPVHIFAGFDQCGRTGTVITLTNHGGSGGYLYALRTPYTNPPGTYGLTVADIPAWDRYPLKVAPNSPIIMLPAANPVGNLSLQVENLSCLGRDWQVTTGASWLSPEIVTGTAAGIALFTVDATGMYTGFYTSPMTLYGTSWSSGSDWDLSRTITVNLWLLDKVYYSYLPIIAKGNR